MAEAFLAMQEVQGSSSEQLNYIISSVLKVTTDYICTETIEKQNKGEA